MGYGLPVRVPMIDIHAIGAGGGSIARVNAGGILQVGPRERGRRSRLDLLRPRRRGSPPSPTPTSSSAASTPRGCSAWTGAAQLEPRPRDIRQEDRRPPGPRPRRGGERHRGAWPTTRWRAPSASSRSQRGHDPRDFALFAFGGAGPLHAVALARELAIPRVVVPARAGHRVGAGLPRRRRAPRLRENGEPARAAPRRRRSAAHPRRAGGGGPGPPRLGERRDRDGGA